ncbi:MAG: PDZ domain-containing protein [Fimbriimonadaceae bacterium]
MWLSAASLAIATSAGGGIVYAVLTPEEEAVWNRLRPSVVLIQTGERSTAPAACIDASGLFLAHRAHIRFPVVRGRTADGSTIQLRLAGIDETTQLALLAVQGTSNRTFRPVETRPSTLTGAPNALRGGLRILAVLGDGPVRAELTSVDRVGIVNPSRRVMSFSEVKFESPLQRVGGGLVFDLQGRLFGVINATLADSQALPPMPDPVSTLAPTAPRVATGRLPAPFQVRSFGPAGLTVAYSIGPNVIERVVEGFRSPERRVNHPRIGVNVIDAPEGGALILEVLPGSTAERAGLRAGDVIGSIAGSKVTNQIVFARVMMDQRIGATVEITYRRGAEERTVLVEIGS